MLLLFFIDLVYILLKYFQFFCGLMNCNRLGERLMNFILAVCSFDTHKT